MTASPGTADPDGRAGGDRPARASSRAVARPLRASRALHRAVGQRRRPVPGRRRAARAGSGSIGSSARRSTTPATRRPAQPVRFIVLTLRSDGIGFASRRRSDRAASTSSERLEAPHDRIRADLDDVPARAAKRALVVAGDADAARRAAPDRRPDPRAGECPFGRSRSSSTTPRRSCRPATSSRLAPLDREAVKVFADLLRDDEIWAEAETADVYPDVVLLITPTAAELSTRVAGLPKAVRVDVPAPDEATRSRPFVRDRARALSRAPAIHGLAERLPDRGAGRRLQGPDAAGPRRLAHGRPAGPRVVPARPRGASSPPSTALLQERLGTIIKRRLPRPHDGRCRRVPGAATAAAPQLRPPIRRSGARPGRHHRRRPERRGQDVHPRGVRARHRAHGHHPLPDPERVVRQDRRLRRDVRGGGRVLRADPRSSSTRRTSPSARSTRATRTRPRRDSPATSSR